ncbi:homoserine O-succinyltransferase [Sneathiella marina]|uniref:Homoserine O-acetyltransferase n=1 Tax=Sneathiella marina TaxID=2950108 RepID=A0ABY4W1A5_9PROT|nr:homoserine O-succinyltransferase [Sneathiella marina]USG60858.1 homoserine O-succinyltransferase [Sneathiella marina]
MPICVNKGLPCAHQLREEGQVVFEGPVKSDLVIGLLNLMPDKKVAERQFARRLGRDDLNVSLKLFRMNDQVCRTSGQYHLRRHYDLIDEQQIIGLDGIIVTGAPVEKLRFEDVDYWTEMADVLSIISKNKVPAVFVCWAAHAALFHFHNVAKIDLPQKAFGIEIQDVFETASDLLRGLTDTLLMPISRHSAVDYSDLFRLPSVKIVAGSATAGPAILEDPLAKQTFILNHFEYEADSLNVEFQRDLAKGLSPVKPDYQYLKTNTDKVSPSPWEHQGQTFYSNWLDIVRAETLTPAEQVNGIMSDKTKIRVA